MFLISLHTMLKTFFSLTSFMLSVSMLNMPQKLKLKITKMTMKNVNYPTQWSHLYVGYMSKLNKFK